MNLSERKKLAQLARRLKAAKARYASLDKRVGTIETRRAAQQEKAGRLINLLYSKKGQSAGAARQKSITAQFIKANKEAERLEKQEKKIYGQMSPIEEKIATLKENMRKVQAKKNPAKKASKGKAALKTTGRALKGATRGILAAGAQILGAGATALNPIRERLLPAGTRVRFKDGYEHGGRTGVITSAIPVYKKEKHWTYRIQLDGISGGKGQVLAEERLFSVINPKRKNKTIIKAKRVVVVKNKTAKRKRNPAFRAKSLKGRTYAWLESELMLADKAAQYHHLQYHNATSDAESKKHYDAQRRIDKYIDRITQAMIVAKKQNPKRGAQSRRRNLDHRDSTHQVQVSKHWRAGGLSQWQRAHHAGQHDLFAHGIKAKAKRNPKDKIVKTKEVVSKQGKRFMYYLREFDASTGTYGPLEWGMGSHATRAEALKAGREALKQWRKSTANPKGKRNASKSSRTRKVASKRRVSSAGRKPGATGSKKRVAATRKRKTNPSPGAIRKEFAGRHTKDSRLYFPDGTPQGLAKLGKLVLIKTKSGPIELVNRKGEVWLCVDTNKRFHLGSTINAPLFDGARNFGEVKEIEYQESKPHLGYTKKIIWFHHMGEEGGRRPELISNSKGELRFRGGDYRITTRGIEN